MQYTEFLIAGVDEAGRGPLAGPVYAAAVILDPERPIDGLGDSKKIGKKCDQISALIKSRALAWAIARSSVEEIDDLNILHASLLAMRRAIEALAITPTSVLVDGLYCPSVSMPARALIKGDASEPAISAASILAKSARDAELRRLHVLYPQYGLDRHKGYPTTAHLAALRVHGVIDIHRRTFAPVRQMLDTVDP